MKTTKTEYTHTEYNGLISQLYLPKNACLLSFLSWAVPLLSVFWYSIIYYNIQPDYWRGHAPLVGLLGGPVAPLAPPVPTPLRLFRFIFSPPMLVHLTSMYPHQNSSGIVAQFSHPLASIFVISAMDFELIELFVPSAWQWKQLRV